MKSFKSLVILMFFFTAVTPILIFSVITEGLVMKRITSDIGRRNDQIVNLASGEIQRWISESENLVRRTGAILFDERLIRDDGIIRYLNILIDSFPYFSSLMVFDSQGLCRHIVPYKEDFAGLDFSRQPFFMQSTDRVNWSPTFLGLTSGEPEVVVSVRKGDRIIAGFLALDELARILSQVHVGTNSSMAVVDPTGTFIAHTKQRKVIEREREYRLESFVSASGEGGRWRVDGRDVSVHMAGVPGVEWKVILYQDREESLESLAATRDAVLLAALASIGLVLLLFVPGLKRIALSVSRFAEHLSEIGSGTYGEAMPDSSPLGRYEEFNAITESFNTMVRHIQEREEELRASEERYHSLFRDSNAVMLLIHPETGRIVEANKGACAYYGYDYPTLSSMSIQDINTLSEEAVKAEMASSLSERRRYFLFKHRLASGDMRDVEVYSGPILFRGEKLLFSIIHDITDRMLLQQKIVDSLKEKEILLKEIHHRVKNNLQIISSLLHLQSSYVKDPADLDLMTESQSRVRSMALIHELFYQSGNFSTIDLRDYIQTLYSNLENMYVDVSMHVQTSIIIDDISLPLDTAIPCGLALNELITNALKYAFRERRTGSLSILGRNEGGMVRMTVKDDGPGIPEGVTLDNPNTLGLRLVTNIAIQLGGDASYRFDGGAEFGLSFPLP